MTYMALYRKWRPRLFAEIVGQDHITRTLKNALEAGHTAHAYLFCGPRGTGKTSTAKILAKAANCRERRTGEPCNACKYCTAIDDGYSMDVVEIDAASNRGIDEMRELREKVGLAPAESSYRVYIIDEVHMLTTEAFNALLKTLEEPPQHVLFILATTEPHKLPATILSRCQRFNFHRVSSTDIIKRLEDVIAENKVKVEPGALRLIADAAEGGVRDALSILEQCLAYGVDKVDLDDVRTVLGMADEEFLEKVTMALGKGQPASLLETVLIALDNGKEPRQLTTQLIMHFRNLLLVCICKTPGDITDVSVENRGKLIKEAAFFSEEQIISIIDLLSKAENDMRWSNFPRIQLEIALLKAGNSIKKAENKVLQGLEQRIAALEKKILPDKMELYRGGDITRAKSLPQNFSEGDQDFSNFKKNIKQERNLSREKITLTINELEKIWDDILKLVKKKRVTTHALLREGKISGLENNILKIAYRQDQSFYVDKLDELEHRETVKNALSEFFRTELDFKCIFLQQSEQKENAGEYKKDADGDEIISRAIELFGEDVVEVKD